MVPPTGSTPPPSPKAFTRSSPNLLHEESYLPRGNQPIDETIEEALPPS
jgi:hypothetical protein